MRSSMLRWRVLAAGFAGAVALMGSSDALASAWTNASGANSAFGWSGGQNNTDHFGNPTVHTWGFAFDDMVNFIAQGGGGSGATATDFARVTVDRAGSVPAGAPAFHFITVQEFGTWSNDISAPTDFTVQADFAVFRLSPSPLGTTGSLAMAVTFNPDGTWLAERTLTAGELGNPPFSDLDWNRFQITVTNTIQVDSGAAAGSFIEKDGMRIIVPEPMSVLFLFAGIGPFVLRRSSR